MIHIIEAEKERLEENERRFNKLSNIGKSAVERGIMSLDEAEERDAQYA